MSEPSTRRPVRLLGATLVGGLAIGFLPSAASATAPEPPAEQSTTAFCANVPADYEPFTDVTGNKANIECAAAADLSQGTSTPTLYNPGGVVSRAQMASFIARLLDTAKSLDVPGDPVLATLPPYDGTNEFTDNPDPAHVANINRLADAGIVLGGPGGLPVTSYGGGRPVQRDQMASFINRAQDFLNDGSVDGDGFSSSSNFFTDDDSSVHEDNIQAIASEGIAIGDGIDTYNPSAGVTRDQMASFLVRHLAVNEEAGLITPAPAPAGGNNQTFAAAPELVSVTNVGSDVVRYTFDETVTGQALVPANFRLYTPAGTYSVPTEVSISGSSILARYPASGVTFAQAAQATVRFGAVSDPTGLLNPAAGFPLQPSGDAAPAAYSPALVSVENWATGPTIPLVGVSVQVDYVFDTADADTEYGLVEGAAPGLFFLVGAQVGLFEGAEIVDIQNDATADTTTVTVQFSTSATDLPESQLRRGYFVVDDGVVATDDLVLSANFGTTGGITENPDLVSVQRVDDDTFEFEFDEAVSAIDAEIIDTEFFVFGADGVPVEANSAERSAVASDEAKVVVVDFAGLLGGTVIVGGFVWEAAVVATDSTDFNSGENRAAQVTVTLPPAPGAPPAGEVDLPQLVSIQRVENVVTGTSEVIFVFDDDVAPATAAGLTYSLYDTNGVRFVGSAPVVSGTTPTEVGVSFTNQDQIAAAVTGDVQTTAGAPAAALVPEEQTGITDTQA